MSEYIFDKRDLEFVLHEQLNVSGLAKYDRFKDFGREDYDIILSEAAKVAQEVLAPINRSGDKQGCVVENGSVRLPEGFVDAFKRFARDGWISPHGDPQFGGQGLPMSFGIALIEMFIGANSSFMFLPGLTTAAAHVIESFGSPEQKSLYCERLFSGEWTGTMCLTEPQAGTSVGEAATTATEVDGEDYHLITGNKIFISAGDHDATDNIIHLVLARVNGDPAGTKGLSLFIVPKYRTDENGKLGEPNDVSVAGIEHKMGINASPTCSLNFGDDGDSRGFLIGGQRQGIIYMFQMMNEARIICGVQGAALGNAAYQHALAYARERIQGSSVIPGKGGKSVPIIDHPDVRRNLMLMKSTGEGLRALLLQTSYYADVVANTDDKAERAKYLGLIELLTPICKAYATDAGFWMTERAIQVFGGYGYIQEFPVEQYMRDLKIASLYEGTNGIQALDLLGRKMRMKGGALFMFWMQAINDLLAEAGENPRLTHLVKALDSAKMKLGEIVFAFPELGKNDPELFVLQATPFLEAFGHVEIGGLLLRQAVIADGRLQARFEAAGIDATNPVTRRAHLADDTESRFYDGKIQGAQFFITQVLPGVFQIAKAIQAADRSALEIVF